MITITDKKHFDILKEQNIHNIIECKYCGASVDITKRVCEYCRTKLNAVNEWSINKIY